MQTAQQRIERVHSMFKALFKYEADLVDVMLDGDRVIVIVRGPDDSEVSMSFDYDDINPKLCS